MVEAEQRLCGVTHAEVGGYLLGLWGLPYPIVEAVANHHAPGRVPQRCFDVLAAVHVADALVNERTARSGTASSQRDALDLAYLEALGVADQAGGWRALVEEQTRTRSAGRAADASMGG